MNINYLKYIVEIADAGSVNNAAKRLGLSQPNLSRDIKELEKDLKIKIFERTPFGMQLTQKGDLLVKYARGILKQIDELESTFVDNTTPMKVFSVSVPRSSYIGDAFASFSNLNKDKKGIEMTYKETISNVCINDVKTGLSNLGIVRYFNSLNGYYEDMLSLAHMKTLEIARPRFEVFFNKQSPLAKLKTITMDDLIDLVSINYANPTGAAGSLPISIIKRDQPIKNEKKIFVYERATAFEILIENDKAFLFSSTIPAPILDQLDILHKPVDDCYLEYVDVLFYREDYNLTDLDKQFIECLQYKVNKYLK